MGRESRPLPSIPQAGLAPSILPRHKARDGFAPCLGWSFPSLPRLVSPLRSRVPFVGDGALAAPTHRRQAHSQSAAPHQKNFFVLQVPEARFSGREESEVQPFGGTDRLGQARAELRLRVLRSLPPRHQRYLFEEIRKVCRDFLRNRGVPSSELTAEELLSEIWQKLLGTVSVGAGETIDLCSGDLTQVSIDPDVPERDGRVVWLVEEIGGAMAIAHRREDILRARFGRASTGNGRPLVQPQGDSVFTDIASDADAAGTLEAADGRRVWRGLLAMIALEFAPSDDLSMLLRLLSEQPGLLQDSPGGQWPITDIVNQLDKRFAPPAWTSDRVDNAKRRLLNWIRRLKRKNGLDDVDLEALFARVAREQERGSETPPKRRHLNPQNWS